jgi:saccharopine dehydrogenase-like NADP-dependent oxidoreductase
MRKVTILGAGRIGRCIAEILQSRGDIEVTLGDRDHGSLRAAAPGVRTLTLDVHDGQALRAVLAGQEAVLSACQYSESPNIATAALETGVSFFDLTEDVASTQTIRELSRGARPGQVFVPQCGLAPGYVGILGAELARRFEQLETLKLRVGALPEMPNNAMLYNLTWSTEGLINEYCMPCDAIKNGQRTKVLALEGLETFALDGAMYEAFNTSGGLGTLSETLDGKVQDLTYKTIRYPGHREQMEFLIHGLQLGRGDRRKLLVKIIEEAVPVTDQDVVVIMVSATGYIGGRFVQQTEHHRIVHGHGNFPHMSAIQVTTASSACVVLDLFLAGELLPEGRDRGFVSQEEISHEKFMERPWAEPYRSTAHLFRKET